MACLQQESQPLFASIRLNNWHSNEEIFNILSYCHKYLPQEDFKHQFLSNQVIQRPHNGSVFLFDRRIVKNFKKDSFMWKRRKTGGANSVREDRMCLKVNGVDSIYGCYSHSSIIATFHRRCYWLLDKPDLVLVHYLQMPNLETAECLIVLNSTNFNITESDIQMNKEDLTAELNAMLWPFWLDVKFVTDNLRANNLPIETNQLNSKSFAELCATHLFGLFSKNKQHAMIRISFVDFCNKKTNEILNQLNLQMNTYNNKEEINFSLKKNSVLDKLIKNFFVDENLNDEVKYYRSSKMDPTDIIHTSEESTGSVQKNHQYLNENKVNLSINSCLSNVKLFYTF
jgi:hypothetical protein